MTEEISRRHLITLASGTALAGAAVVTSPRSAAATGPYAAAAAVLPSGLFTLGVASGDPKPHGAVLWTRLAPDPLAGGGMPAQDVTVRWQVAEDDRFRRVVRSGTARA